MTGQRSFRLFILGWIFLSGLTTHSQVENGYWDGRFWVPSLGLATSLTQDGQGRLWLIGQGVLPATIPPLYSISGSRWDGRSWTAAPDFGINSLLGSALVEGTLFIAGRPKANQIFHLEDLTPKPLPELVQGTVRALAAGPQGLLVGGAFTTAKGATNIARWDGSAWQPLANGLPIAVDRLTVTNNIVLAAVSGLTNADPAGVWRWESGQWINLGELAPGGEGRIADMCWVSGGPVVAVRNADGKLVVRKWDGAAWNPLSTGNGDRLTGQTMSFATLGGELHVLGSLTLEHNGRLDPIQAARWHDGAWETLLADPYLTNELPPAVTQSAEGLLCLMRRSFGAPLWGGMVLLSYDGSLWRLLSNGIYQGSSTLRIANHDPGPVVTSDSRDSQLRGGLRWEETGLVSLDPNNQSDGSRLDIGGLLAGDGTNIFAASRIENGIYRLVRLVGNHWVTASTATSVKPTAVVLTANNGVLLAGTDEANGAVPGSIVIEWDGTTWQSLLGNFTGANVSLDALVEFRKQPVVGGTFTAVDEQHLPHLAGWNGRTWQPLGHPPDGPVRDMTVWENRLLIAGSFTNVGGLHSPGIAVWDGSVWSSLGDTTVLGHGTAVAVSDDGRVALATHQVNQIRLWIWRDNRWTKVAESYARMVNDLLWVGHDLHFAGGTTVTGNVLSAPYGIWHEPGIVLVPVAGQPGRFKITGARPIYTALQRSADLQHWETSQAYPPLFSPDSVALSPATDDASFHQITGE